MVDETARRIVFTVQGSEPDPYTVVFTRYENGFTATCTCRAALAHQACKHRLAILRNSPSGLVSQNLADVAVVANWLPGSAVELALCALAQAEHDLGRAK